MYKIRSLKVFRTTVITLCVVLIGVLLAELVFDLKSTSPTVLLPTTVATYAVLLLSLRFPDSIALRIALTTIVYVFIEVHFLSNIKTFHTITYWFPFVPIIGLIIQGVRPAMLWVVIMVATLTCNYLYVEHVVGENYALTIRITPFYLIGLIFCLTIFLTTYFLYNMISDAYGKLKEQNEVLEDAHLQANHRRHRLEQYQHEIIVLSKDDIVTGRSRLELFKRICATASSTLQANRVSVWLFEKSNNNLVRQFLFEAGVENDSQALLERRHYPTYFDAVETKPFVMASEAREHPDTSEFTDNYFKPLNIMSLLDCPIVVDRKAVGVICCEHQNHIRYWSTEDALFLQSLSDLISANYKNERIKNLLGEIRRQNNELFEKNHEIESMNAVLSSLNQDLSGVNDNLEQMVQHRTQELELQNTQLTEYAFINSHLLRAPLSRILGLSQLLLKEATSLQDIELLNALMKSTHEMDAIIKRISDILYDGNNLTREDLQSIIDRNLNQGEL